MKRFNRIIAIALVLVMISAFASCGKKTEEESTTTTTAPSTEATAYQNTTPYVADTTVIETQAPTQAPQTQAPQTQAPETQVPTQATLQPVSIASADGIATMAFTPTSETSGTYTITGACNLTQFATAFAEANAESETMKQLYIKTIKSFLKDDVPYSITGDTYTVNGNAVTVANSQKVFVQITNSTLQDFFKDDPTFQNNQFILPATTTVSTSNGQTTFNVQCDNGQMNIPMSTFVLSANDAQYLGAK